MRWPGTSKLHVIAKPHTHTHGQWRMTYDIDDLQFIVHLELEGEVAMVVGVGPTPLLHTQQHTPSQIKTTAKEFTGYCVYTIPMPSYTQAPQKPT